jgi:hypothetical protein
VIEVGQSKDGSQVGDRSEDRGRDRDEDRDRDEGCSKDIKVLNIYLGKMNQ